MSLLFLLHHHSHIWTERSHIGLLEKLSLSVTSHGGCDSQQSADPPLNRQFQMNSKVCEITRNANSLKLFLFIFHKPTKEANASLVSNWSFTNMSSHLPASKLMSVTCFYGFPHIKNDDETNWSMHTWRKFWVEPSHCRSSQSEVFIWIINYGRMIISISKNQECIFI